MTITEKMDKALAEQALVLKDKSDSIELPVFNAEIDELLNRKLSRRCYRIIKHLMTSNGCTTQELNRVCSAANISDVTSGNRTRLLSIGMKVTCMMIKQKNQFNEPVNVGSWWLEVIDREHLIKAINERKEEISKK